jgi:hypothetical protein
MFRVKTTVDDEIPGSIPIAHVLQVALLSIESLIFAGGVPRENTCLAGGTYGGGGGGGGGPDDFDPPPPIVSTRQNKYYERNKMPPPPTVQPPPTVDTPPPKDVPWWGAFILAVLTAVVSVIGTIFFLRGSTPGAPGAPPGMGQIFTDIITFIPHILILFGVLADIFTLQGVYSIPSLVGLLALPVHKAMEYLWLGVATVLGDAYRLAMTAPPPAAAPRTGGAMSAWPGCDVYGFEYFHSRYAPQGLVVTSTIFWYYLIDLFMNRNILDSVAAIFAFMLFFGLETLQLKMCKDFTDSVWIKAFIALSEGFFIGGVGYAIVQSSAPNRLPSAVLPQGPSLASLTKNADGSYTDASGEVYIVGPDGRPIKRSFIAAATSGAATSTTGGASALTTASATTCPT